MSISKTPDWVKKDDQGRPFGGSDFSIPDEVTEFKRGLDEEECSLESSKQDAKNLQPPLNKDYAIPDELTSDELELIFETCKESKSASQNLELEEIEH